jgi:hypothetical protein
VEPIVSATELTVISEENLVAILKFHTDQGPFEFAINESAAHGLIDILAKFVTREAKPS